MEDWEPIFRTHPRQSADKRRGSCAAERFSWKCRIGYRGRRVEAGLQNRTKIRITKYRVLRAYACRARTPYALQKVLWLNISRTKVRIMKSEISTRTWHSPMRAASQGAFVVSLGISLGDISYMIIKKRIRFLMGILSSLFSRFCFCRRRRAGSKQALVSLFMEDLRVF